tara:strand:- start:161 stop:268 length:108 start_codon:yes stop_codon:yes gene_type:complete
MSLTAWLMVIVTWIILIDIHSTIKKNREEENGKRK